MVLFPNKFTNLTQGTLINSNLSNDKYHFYKKSSNKNAVIQNKNSSNNTQIKNISVKPKYVYKSASPWKQQAFGIRTMAALPGGCGCGG